MNKLIERIESLNRKERFAVFREISGLKESRFPLRETFRKRLDTCISRVRVPEIVYCATDYHLDWIELALFTYNIELSKDNVNVVEQSSNNINENQQDIDLLIAFTKESNQNTPT